MTSPSDQLANSAPSDPNSVSLRDRFQAGLPWVTAAWVLLELLSLRLGLLNAFFFDTSHADVQGIDFYSLPKAWLNLASGRSLYGTFDPPAFGPHFTWYLAHPLLAITLGWPLSRFGPSESYGSFTLLSLSVMSTSAALWARETEDPLHRCLIWLMLLGSFPTFLMLWVGNVQCLTVLGLTLSLVGFVRLQRERPFAGAYLLLGLLVSLFTKPVVLLMLPLLLFLPESRRWALTALGIYLPVSLLCVFVPALNPEGVGLSRLVWLLTHPGFVRETMDVYANRLQLTPDMRDNSIHWFNLVAQSGFRLQHVDVYSLPVFLDGLVGRRTPDWPYLLPTALVLGLSAAVARMREPGRRQQAALLLLMAASLDFFLTYPTVWEYQYTAVLPVAAGLLVIGPDVLPQQLRRWCLALALCICLPSLYFLSGSAAPTPGILAVIRADRVVPVSALFAILILRVGRAALSRANQLPHVTAEQA